MAVAVTETTLFFLLSFIAFLFALSVHESAHALVADRCGDPTARLAGRISLNPLRHMEMFGTVILPVLTSLSGFVTFGWAKPTPVDLRKLRRPRRDDILVSFAGPASNLLTALGCVVLLGIIRLTSSEGAEIVNRLARGGAPGVHDSILSPLAWLLHRVLVISVVLGIFNLYPVPPLDGSHILNELLPARARAWYRGFARYGFVVLLVVLWYTPLGRWTLDPPLAALNSLLRM
jgi:Zn-dependent protease